LRPLYGLNSLYNSNLQVNKMYPTGLAKTYLHSNNDINNEANKFNKNYNT